MSHKEEPAGSDKKPAASGGSSMKLIIVMALFMVVVIGVECAIAAFMIPSAEKVAQMAEAKLAAKTPKLKGHEEEEEGKEGEGVKEVKLGEYGVTAHQPASNTTIRIDFKLYGTVAEEDAAKFEESFTRNEHRIRDAVLVIVRNAEVGDLTDPTLGLLKRRILEKSNRLLGKPMLQSVVFSDFSFIEQ